MQSVVKNIRLARTLFQPRNRTNSVGLDLCKTVTLRHLSRGVGNTRLFKQNLTAKTGRLSTSAFRLFSTHESAIPQTSASATADIGVHISDNKKHINVAVKGGLNSSFHATWLRHQCQCPRCVDIWSRQKLRNPALMPAEYTVQSATVVDGCVNVLWTEEGSDHVGIFPLDFLERHDYSKAARLKKAVDTRPRAGKGYVPRVSYQEIIDSERGLWEWLKNLSDWGICIVHGIPTDKTVVELAGIIGPIQTSLYGESYEVWNKPNDTRSITYTSAYIDMHMDLQYYSAPPGFQFLFCKEFPDVITGGESIWIDAWYEAQQMKERYPDDFKVLSRVPATFHADYLHQEGKQDYIRFQRPHFKYNEETDQVISVNWAPFLEGPLSIPEEDIEPYYKAYKRFADLLDNGESKILYRLKEGEMVSYNNYRMFHGRKSFELNGARRLLEGCYVEVDTVKSLTHVLGSKYEPNHPIKHNLNGSWT